MTTYRIAVDTGGTFTDVVVATPERVIGLFKATTTPDDVYVGIHRAMEQAAAAENIELRDLLAGTESFVYSTTHATNAVLEQTTARTALITTAGHRDILLYKEGGRTDVHNQSVPFPDPYVPRHLTFELNERVYSDGEVAVPLDEHELRGVIERVQAARAEAVAVCLLWSIVNPAHELAVAAAMRRCAPGLPYSLSHRVNPIIREYRRASATALDASLKPLMQAHLEDIEGRLRADGLSGQPLMVTHLSGGVMTLAEMCKQPVHTIDSGPSLAPVAGLTVAREAGDAEPDLVVIDAGGTSFEVSLTRRGELVYTREKWLGARWLGHMTGLPAVDVKSIGAGGGSIAYVDSGGLLRVGPHSAGATPGPACYGLGGRDATVTDAAVVLGFIDPEYFLGGRMPLHAERAREAVARIGTRLGVSCEDAAAAIMAIASENMRGLILDMTMTQGIDPRGCTIVLGGGAAGLNALTIAQELSVGDVIIPRLAAGLSALGGHYSDLTKMVSTAGFVSSQAADLHRMDECVGFVRAALHEFCALHAHVGVPSTKLLCESRYVGQLWEIDVDATDLPDQVSESDLDRLRDRFDRAHHELFAVNQPGADIEIVTWRGEARITGRKPALYAVTNESATTAPHATRPVYLDGRFVSVPVWRSYELAPGAVMAGPGILEDPATSIVIPAATTIAVHPANFVVKVASVVGDTADDVLMGS